MSDAKDHIDSVLKEDRVFAPPDRFSADAFVPSRAHWSKLEERGYVEGNVVPLAARPEQFLIAVAGGESGHHALYFCTFGLTWSVTKRFTLDATWSGGESCPLPPPRS